MSKIKETPLMKQYNDIKKEHPESILLFRVGDFYETFSKDAINASKILDIVLTKRSNGAASSVELAGFPHHALDNYLPKLIKAGFKVAICEQLENPFQSKGIIKRGVTELITPGLSYHDSILEKTTNNYLASLYIKKDKLGIALLDFSTGEFVIAEGEIAYTKKILENYNPIEIIFNRQQKNEILTIFPSKTNYFTQEEWIYNLDYANEKLNKKFNTKSLKGYGIESYELGIVAAGAILQYLEDNKQNNLSHINSISRINNENHVWLDQFTIKNLELIVPQHELGKSLYDTINNTNTSMGSRLLKKWLLMPLISKEKIANRHHVVTKFINTPDIKDDIIQNLTQISDIERISVKISTHRITQKELIALKKSIINITKIKQLIEKLNIETNIGKIHDLQEVSELINNTLEDDVSNNIVAGKIIKKGVNKELDDLKQKLVNSKIFLNELKNKEIKKTGISSLKISYNKIFGYYIEVSNTHKTKVPSTWIRKQTLTNAERYVTEELKEHENIILNSEEKIDTIEQKLYAELILALSKNIKSIQDNAQKISTVDCLASFAQQAIFKNYIKPSIEKNNIIKIIGGRHPVIEEQLSIDKKYIANDIHLDTKTQQIIIVTGPNMAGKSALLRQVALIVILSQIGSYVPAKEVTISITDKIFSRVGAWDNISKGESTFMVEMTETAKILNNFGENSLIIMDEIGRGTSTQDGIAIAQAIVEFLHNSKHKPKTLFATHYHELISLEKSFSRIKNYHIEVKKVENKIIFMHKLKKGGTTSSFGINVAQMAGIPEKVVLEATKKIQFLNKVDYTINKNCNNEKIKNTNHQHSKYKKLKERVENLDTDNITPIEALLEINNIKELLKKQ